jgi:hypothetical protein
MFDASLTRCTQAKSTNLQICDALGQVSERDRLKNTALCHVLSQWFSDLTSPIVFTPFWTGSFLIMGLVKADPFPASHLLHIWYLWIFCLGGFAECFVYHDKVQLISCQSCRVYYECIISEMLASTWRETEYCLNVCHATSGAVLRYTEHVRGPVFENVSVSTIHFMVEDV